jgi:hypothetical protein
MTVMAKSATALGVHRHEDDKKSRALLTNSSFVKRQDLTVRTTNRRYTEVDARIFKKD